MRWFVYILGNARGATYVGVTRDASPERRLAEHNTGCRGARSTRNKGPWQLLYVELAIDRAAALRREWFLKHRCRAFRRQLASQAATLFQPE